MENWIGTRSHQAGVMFAITPNRCIVTSCRKRPSICSFLTSFVTCWITIHQREWLWVSFSSFLVSRGIFNYSWFSLPHRSSPPSSLLPKASAKPASSREKHLSAVRVCQQLTWTISQLVRSLTPRPSLQRPSTRRRSIDQLSIFFFFVLNYFLFSREFEGKFTWSLMQLRTQFYIFFFHLFRHFKLKNLLLD